MKAKEPIDKWILTQLLLEAVQKVTEDECCPQEIREDAMECDVSIDHALVNAELVVELFNKLCTKKNIDAFYVEFMGSIVPKTSAWFPNLEDGTAVRIAMQFGEKMVHYAHKPVFLEVTEKESNDIKRYSFYCLFWRICDKEFAEKVKP